MRALRSTIILSVLGMPAVVSVVHAGDTSLTQSAWSRSTVQPDPGLRDPQLRKGQEVFQARCQACHGEISKDIVPGGIPPMPGTQALQARYKGEKPAPLELRTDLTPEFITAIVRNGINSMPFFRPTEITDTDLAALGAYLSRRRPQNRDQFSQ